MNSQARMLLTRTLSLFAEMSAGKFPSDEIDAGAYRLGSDITDALRDDTLTIRENMTAAGIVDAIDRQTEQQDRYCKTIIQDRADAKEQQRAAIEYYRNQNLRDEERIAQLRKQWAELATRPPIMSNDTRFDVDGVLCRFRSVIDRDSYLVVAEDGTHHRIPIEGAKEVVGG